MFRITLFGRSRPRKTAIHCIRFSILDWNFGEVTRPGNEKVFKRYFLRIETCQIRNCYSTRRVCVMNARYRVSFFAAPVRLRGQIQLLAKPIIVITCGEIEFTLSFFKPSTLLHKISCWERTSKHVADKILQPWAHTLNKLSY